MHYTKAYYDQHLGAATLQMLVKNLLLPCFLLLLQNFEAKMMKTAILKEFNGCSWNLEIS